MMARIKIGFRLLSVLDQIARARMIKGKMTGNSHFPNPNPSLALLDTAVNRLETAYIKSRHRDTREMQLMRLRRKGMLELIRKLAAYVQQASGGDPEIILSSGFDIVLIGTLDGALGQARNLRLRQGPYVGSLYAWWDSITDALAYDVQISDTDGSPESFRHFRIAVKGSFLLTGLTPGHLYYVRVCPVGTKGYGLYSDAARQTATI